MLKQLAGLALAALAALVGGPALADGMRGSLKDAPAPMPTWSGFYIGAGVGYAHVFGENNYIEPGATISQEVRDGEGLKGGLATIVLGFDRQIRDRIVAGLFVEYDWSNIEISYINNTLSSEETFRIDRSWSVGGRVGYLVNPATLLYFTGGWTWAHGKNDRYFDIDPTGPAYYAGVGSVDFKGFFVGLGMEVLLAERLALRGEVRYTKFGDEVVNSQPIFTDTFEPEVLAGRLVLTYKFWDHRRYEEPRPLK
jgi:outer membrane immunogenic protein